MELIDIKTLVLAADPQAKHYEHPEGDEPYTVWQELRRLPILADDKHERGWAFAVDRFTKDEFDEIAERIEQVLSDAVGVSYEYIVDYEPDTGYIHHAFSCQGV